MANVAVALHRIGVSGSAGTGKSTLAKALADRLGVVYLDEGIRRRFEQGLDIHQLTNHELQDLCESLLDELLSEVGMHLREGFVSDRSPPDFLAFWLYYGFGGKDPDRTERIRTKVTQALTHYQDVVLLPWDAIPLVDDGVRSTNKWIQLHFQALLEGLVTHHVVPTRIQYMPATHVTVQRRVAWLVQRLGL